MGDSKKLYGLLSYETINIGDEIQSLAARNFLPRIDVLLDRDHLNKVKSNKKIKLIMNGWFTEKPWNWPPSSDIKPLFVSFHISEKSISNMTSKKSIEYLKKYEPIGCRDYHTRDLLIKNGVKAYFSGCMTLTLQRKMSKRSDEILLVDLNLAGINLKDLPLDLLKKSKVLSHKTFDMDTKNMRVKKLRGRTKRLINPIYRLIVGSKRDNIKRFNLAKEYLKRYARAKLVITSRIHCALPCLAFGTPVIFVHKNLKDPRFEGLKDYLRCYTPEEFKNKINEIGWNNPLPNPKSIKRLRNNLINTVEEFIQS